jgi:predicted phosphodiesterase
LSDVHFDLDPTKAEYNSFVLPKRAEYLILAGDIGSLSQDFENYSAFLIRQCRVFKRVFLVLGECEFKPLKAKKNHAEGVETARRLPDMPEMNGRLTLLEKNRYDLTEDDGTTVSILGCTLWSQFQQKYLKEKQFEFFENTTITHTARFADHLSWLRASVKAIRDGFGKARKILVVTHHAPTIKNSDKTDREARMESGQYGTDILGGKALKVKGLGRGDVWVYGHTNYTTEFYAAGVRVLANQRGPGNPAPVVNPGIHEFDVERTFEM